ncbi:MAG: hypothetical protein II882_07125 [Lachnospiraceae bacterium]|nr:hypothetical protein [Lachnospiraceae bacterium]
MPNPNQAQLTDKVLPCTDRVYRWIYELPMLKSFFLLLEVWRCLLIGALFPFLLVMIFSSDSFVERLKTAGGILGIVLGIFFVLSFPAYWIVTKANNGKYTVLFEMDDEWISHTQIKTDKARALEVLTMFAGAASGNATMAGIGLLNASGGSLSCRYDRVRTIKAKRRKNLIRVNTRLIRNQVYVSDGDFDFVLQFLKEHCPNARFSG